MHIFPAIDILGKKVVRLTQGDYEKSEIFGEDPVEIARGFVDNNAVNLHIVDLDGAKAGTPVNRSAIKRIVSEFPNLFIQCGGGIRNEETVENYLSCGVGRIILGTSALRDRIFTRWMLRKYQDRIAIGIDARDSMVSVEGWTVKSNTDSIEFCRIMKDLGAKYIIYTDISKDGTGNGTDIKVYERLLEIEDVSFTASGGVSSYEEIEQLKRMGIYAVILGKAIYTGLIDLKKSIEIAKGEL